MAVRSKRILGPVALPAAAAGIYTVPAGRTLVVRTVTFFNNTGAAQICRLSTTASAANSVAYANVLAATPAIFEHWMAFNPGDTIFGFSTAGTAVVHIFGALLLGEPE